MQLLTATQQMSKQKILSALNAVFLSQYQTNFNSSMVGIFFTDHENKQLNQVLIYNNGQTVKEEAYHGAELHNKHAVLSYCLETRKDTNVDSAWFQRDTGVSAVAGSIYLHPVHFDNMFAVLFAHVISEQSLTETQKCNAATLGQHYITHYSYLDTIKRQASNILQLEKRIHQMTSSDAAVQQRDRSRLACSIIGTSRLLEELRVSIQRVAKAKCHVLIRGETGSGKELVAQELYRLMPEFSGQMIVQNCAAIPADLLESELFGYQQGAFTGAERNKQGLISLANNGILFLDEIGDMSLPLQAKMLRVLQEKSYRPLGSEQEYTVDFRLLAATHQPLETLIKQGAFREDLYYRLRQSIIQVPPLRKRKSDIPALVDHFIMQYVHENSVTPKHISPNAIQVLMQYDYPGNVRELKNIVNQMCLQADNENTISDSVAKAVFLSLNNEQPAFIVPDISNLQHACLQFETSMIRKALATANGNRQHAAELLETPLRTLSYKCKKYGI